jgi:hypothetical protein
VTAQIAMVSVACINCVKNIIAVGDQVSRDIVAYSDEIEIQEFAGELRPGIL